MKAKRGILLISLLLGIVTAFAVYRLVKSYETVPEETIIYRNVVVALNTIPEHTVLSADMLRLAEIPEEAVHAEAFRSIEEAIGSMTSSIIVKDEQVLSSRLISQSGENTKKLSYRIPEHMRAISIPVNELSAVSGHIAEGDKIDILVTYNSSDFYPGKPRPAVEDEERLKATVYTQFQLLEVLRIGTPSHAGEDSSTAGSIVLLVSPEQAEELVYVLNTGSITLLLRNPADDTIHELEFYNADSFREERGIR